MVNLCTVSPLSIFLGLLQYATILNTFPGTSGWFSGSNDEISLGDLFFKLKLRKRVDLSRTRVPHSIHLSIIVLTYENGTPTTWSTTNLVNHLIRRVNHQWITLIWGYLGYTRFSDTATVDFRKTPVENGGKHPTIYRVLTCFNMFWPFKVVQDFFHPQLNPHAASHWGSVLGRPKAVASNVDNTTSIWGSIVYVHVYNINIINYILYCIVIININLIIYCIIIIMYKYIYTHIYVIIYCILHDFLSYLIYKYTCLSKYIAVGIARCFQASRGMTREWGLVSHGLTWYVDTLEGNNLEGAISRKHTYTIIYIYIYICIYKYSCIYSSHVHTCDLIVERNYKLSTLLSNANFKIRHVFLTRQGPRSAVKSEKDGWRQNWSQIIQHDSHWPYSLTEMSSSHGQTSPGNEHLRYGGRFGISLLCRV